jgi:glycogen operon protein
MIYVGMNMHWEDHVFAIPALPVGVYWHLFVDTDESAEKHIFEPGTEPELEDQHHIVIGARSVVILVGK